MQTPKHEPKINIDDPLASMQSILISMKSTVEDTLKEIKTSIGFYNNTVIAVFLFGFLVTIISVVAAFVQSFQFNVSLSNATNTIKVQEELIKNTVEQQSLILENQKIIMRSLERKDIVSPVSP